MNDVVLTRRAAYFTDSLVQQLYRVAIGKDGSIGEPTRVPITGDLSVHHRLQRQRHRGATRRTHLIVVQSNVGKLFAVDARSGASREIELNTPVTNGDGLLLHGRTLYVVQNQLNRIAVVKLGRRRKTGRVVGYLTNDKLDVPTTIAPFKQFIYAVNARFDRPDESDDDLVRLRPERLGALRRPVAQVDRVGQDPRALAARRRRSASMR